MRNYLAITVVILLLANAASFFYFRSKIEAKDAVISLSKAQNETLAEKNNELTSKVEFLELQVTLENSNYLKAIEDFEAYKKIAANIKPMPVPSIKPVIIEKEVPAEVIVEQANEGSNEVLRRISTSADNFKRVLND